MIDKDHLDSGMELLQGDLAVNFFMVLLSVLATLVIAGTIVSSVGFKVHISNQEDNENPLGLSKGWQPIQKIRHRLIIRNGKITLVNLTPIAESLASGKPFPSKIQGLDQTELLKEDPSPSAYLLVLYIGNDPLPSGLITWQINTGIFNTNVVKLPDKVKKFFDTENELDLLIYPDEKKAGWDLAYYLHNKNKRYELLFQKKGILWFQRKSSLFTFESIYK